MAFKKCPGSSIRGKDDQSDKEAWRLFNPAYLRDPVYDDPGWQLYQFYNALCFAGWTASRSFDATVRNLIRMQAHLLTRLQAWPADATFEPAFTTEESIEFFFGSQSIFVSALFQSNLCHVAFVEIALRVLVCGTGTVATRIWEMASSKRKIEGKDRADFAELATEALQLAATLAAAYQIGKTPNDVLGELKQWWRSVGSHLLLVETCADDEEDEDRVPEGHELIHSVEVAETDVVLHKELLEASEGLQNGFLDAEEQPDEDPVPDDSDEEVLQPEKQPKVEPLSVRTLKDVLVKAGLQGYLPAKDDDESKLLIRIRKIAPYMSSFCGLVRSAEKILSKASILGHVRMKTLQHQLEHELAQARSEFHCSAMRQSRFALWCDFSSRVLDALNDDSEGKDQVAEVAGGIAELQSLAPSSFDIDGSRSCQLVCCRPFAAGAEAGPLRLGLVVAVWRGGKGKKDYPWPEGHLKINAATKVHVRLLTPTNQKLDGKEVCTCSALSPIVVMDALGGSLLAEVPQGAFDFEFLSDKLQVLLPKKIVKAFFKVAKADVPFEPKKKSESGLARTFYTEDDFARTNAGAKCIQKYMESMKVDYEALFSPLEKEDGKLSLRSDIQTTWPEILARSTSYFKRYLKNHEHWKVLSKEYQALSYGRLVMLELQGQSPLPSDDPSRFKRKVYTRNNFDIVNGFTATLLRMSPDLVTQPEAVSEQLGQGWKGQGQLNRQA
ncbi:Uncharacterized protein SCF082_LOCUS50954 [Durusdinium trenchii]|uniref:Uncharacterized protein n=1 Tax=Durusdinium trenchii TaxID=1381693 RepID=A0ABP0SBC9_9DINO